MRRTLALVAIAMLSLPNIGHAIFGVGDIVLDPSNLVENAYTAARTLQSNANEAIQIQNQLNQIIQQAKHLVALPISVIDQATSLAQQYTDLMNQGKAISWQVQSSVQAFDDLFATGFNGNIPLMQRAQRMASQIREIGRVATMAESIYARLCLQQANVQTLTAASLAAPGTLAATQANGQLLAVLADQGASLQQIAATASRVQVSFIMREITAEERAQWQSQQWLATYPTTGFRGPGQGQGPKLPD